MIGYYVHHHGHGHLHRAQAIATHLSGEVTGISSLPAPHGWPGPWLRLDRDDYSPESSAQQDPSASGRLHWVPRHDPGLRSRMAAIAQWLDRTAPELVVVDVSVEVVLLVRLHGIPVVSLAVPGIRGDAAHRLGYDVSDAIIGAWPTSARHGSVTGLDEDTLRRIRAVGAISRFPVADRTRTRPRTVTALFGSGGNDFPRTWLERAQTCAPDWSWTVLGGPGGWDTDPWPALVSATVVVTHAGQNALAEVAAARRPAVVVPQRRPHNEQDTTADVLAASAHWPVEVLRRDQEPDWPALLDRVAGLDGARWSRWCDGRAAERAARVIEEIRRSEAAGSAR
ncbi:MAG: glycosyl transferase [Actinomycetota bacterium]|nr:glycosyl transferase [Actinomycetota bacterium]